MSTVSVGGPSTFRTWARPWAAALFGAAVFAAAMTGGEVFDLNAGAADRLAVTLADLAVYAALVGAAVALTGWLGTRALAGSPQLLQRTAIGLAVGSAVTVVVFWSGWPLVLGAAAVALAFEHRQRVGSFSVATAAFAVLAALAFVAAAVACVTG